MVQALCTFTFLILVAMLSPALASEEKQVAHELYGVDAATAHDLLNTLSSQQLSVDFISAVVVSLQQGCARAVSLAKPSLKLSYDGCLRELSLFYDRALEVQTCINTEVDLLFDGSMSIKGYWEKHAVSADKLGSCAEALTAYALDNRGIISWITGNRAYDEAKRSCSVQRLFGHPGKMYVRHTEHHEALSHSRQPNYYY